MNVSPKEYVFSLPTLKVPHSRVHFVPAQLRNSSFRLLLPFIMAEAADQRDRIRLLMNDLGLIEHYERMFYRRLSKIRIIKAAMTNSLNHQERNIQGHQIQENRDQLLHCLEQLDYDERIRGGIEALLHQRRLDDLLRRLSHRLMEEVKQFKLDTDRLKAALQYLRI